MPAPPDAAREAGKIPCLAGRLRELQACAAAVRNQIAADPEIAWFLEPDCESEVTLIWKIGPVWCRALADKINRRLRRIADLKTTMMSAEPVEIGMKLAREYATQDTWYLTGAETLMPTPEGAEPWTFTFIAAERDAPFCISAHQIPREIREVAMTQMKQATMTFARCLITGDWPGYAKGLHTPQITDRAMGRAADSLLQWSDGSRMAA